MNGAVMAVIPARGGSKRAPEKTSVRWETGRCSPLRSLPPARRGSATRRGFPRRNSEIAETAMRLGCSVLRRPDPLATDLASTESVLLHALDEAAKQGWRPTWILTLPPTSPFRRAGTIRFFLDRAADAGVDCLFSVTETRADLWCRDATGKIARLFPGAPRRQQDRAPLYEENSAVYLTSVAALYATGSVLGKSQQAVAIDPLEGFDINSELDFAIANALVAAEPALEPRLVQG